MLALCPVTIGEYVVLHHEFLNFGMLTWLSLGFAYGHVIRAGKNGRKEQIEGCANQCQIPYQTAAAVTQQELGNFQNRLQRSMMHCQDEAQGMITPDMQNDDRKMKKAEDTMIRCMEDAIQKSREGLKPMRERMESQLK